MLEASMRPDTCWRRRGGLTRRAHRQSSGSPQLPAPLRFASKARQRRRPQSPRDAARALVVASPALEPLALRPVGQRPRSAHALRASGLRGPTMARLHRSSTNVQPLANSRAFHSTPSTPLEVSAAPGSVARCKNGDCARANQTQSNKARKTSDERRAHGQIVAPPTSAMQDARVGGIRSKLALVFRSRYSVGLPRQLVG